MDSETYWQQRTEELEQHWHDKGRQTIEKELQALYEDALDAIQDDIAAFYGRFAKDNELSVVEAMRLLQGREYRKWRMSIDAYVAQIAATGDKELEKELNVLAMRSRITRLDKLYAETLVEIAKLDQETRDKIGEFLPSAYRDFYYHSLYDIGQRRGLDGAVSRVDSEQIEKVLRTPWSGKNYSARIWKNGRKLARTIRDVTVQAVHRGSSISTLSQQVSQRMGVGYRQSVRLVRTELNYVQNRAILDGIKDSGMKYYRFVATLDRRTSATCRDHDGHIYPVDDYSPGTNAPPLHPHCRSTIVGSIKGDSKPKGEQAARDESGKYTRVPASMTYEDWKEVYVDKKITLREWKVANGNDIIKAKKDTDLAKAVGDEHYNSAHAILERKYNLRQAVNVWGKYEENIRIDTVYGTYGVAFARGNRLTLNIEEVSGGDAISKPYQTLFHEGGHAIDSVLGRTGIHFSSLYENGKFASTIHSDVDGLVKERMKINKEVFTSALRDADFTTLKSIGADEIIPYLNLTFGTRVPEWRKTQARKFLARAKYKKAYAYKAIENEIKGSFNELAYGDLSDILEGATNGKIRCGIGHMGRDKGYWKKRVIGPYEDGLSTEAFAEFLDSALGNEDSLVLLKKYLPNAYKVFVEMLEDALKR